MLIFSLHLHMARDQDKLYRRDKITYARFAFELETSHLLDSVCARKFRPSLVTIYSMR